MAEQIAKLARYSTVRVIREQIAPVSARTLRGWARQGLVRVAKLGNSRQAPALFRTEDVLAVLAAFSDGRHPVTRRR